MPDSRSAVHRNSCRSRTLATRRKRTAGRFRSIHSPTGDDHVIICEPSTLGDDPEAGRRVLRGPLVEAPSSRCRTAQRCETAGRWPEGGYAVVVGALRCRAARAPLKGRGGRARSMSAPANESPRGHHFTHSSLRRTLRNKDLTPYPTWWTLSPSWKIRRPT